MAGGAVRAVGRAYLVLGLAAACYAMYAISLDPATFQQLQLQGTMIKDSGHQPEQGELDCVVTAAEAMAMRADAVLLLQWGVAEALMAMAAVSATSRFITIWAQVVSLGMAKKLIVVHAVVVDLAIGHCHGSYHQALATGFGNVTASFGVLFLAGLLIALFSKVDD